MTTTTPTVLWTCGLLAGTSHVHMCQPALGIRLSSLRSACRCAYLVCCDSCCCCCALPVTLMSLQVNCCTPGALLPSGDVVQLERCNCTSSEGVGCGDPAEGRLLWGFDDFRWVMAGVPCRARGGRGMVTTPFDESQIWKQGTKATLKHASWCVQACQLPASIMHSSPPSQGTHRCCQPLKQSVHAWVSCWK